MLNDVESSAAALYDGGWRAEDKDQLIAEYDLTEDEADVLCEQLEQLEPEVRTLRIQTGLSQRAFGELLNIPVRTIEDWEAGRRTPPNYVAEMIEERVKRINPKGDVKMGVYTSLTGTRYDVHDFLEILENLLGELPAIGNERSFYSTIQKIAQSKGCSIAWISKSTTNDVILDTLVDKPHYAVVGFGVEKKEDKNKLMGELKIAKEELEKVTDEDMQKAIFEHYKNKAKKYNL